MMKRTAIVLGAVVVCGFSPAGVRAEVTFNKDVAPILFKNCASCHRPGEIGPFSLLTYKDAAKRAKFLAEVTASRQMPPWKAEPGYASFLDERKLGDADLKTIAEWAKAGAPEGDPKDLPPAPKFADGWQLGEPDLILKMTKPYTVPASGRDVIRSFVVPTGVPEDRTVAAVEFRPGNRKVVHHAILFLDADGQARKKDGEDGQPGFRTFGGAGFRATGGLGAWAPGSTPRPLPDGVGRYMRKGSDLVLQIHYHPDGKEEADQSQVGVYFTRKPVEKLIGGLAVMKRLTPIPAGEKAYKVSASSVPLPADVDLLSVFPHMHWIGREMKIYAETPDGKEVPLFWVKDWDFNWQGSYAFAKPVRLTKGTVVKMEAVYDNSTDNPRNPNNPPKRVTPGEGTDNEMCLCGMTLVTDSLDDLRKVSLMRGSGALATLLLGAVTRADINAFEASKSAGGDRKGGAGPR
jgi:hypothetical protein